MHRARLDIIRGGIEAFSRGDFDAALIGFDPDIEWEVGPDLLPDGQTYRGHEGVLEFWHTWHQLFNPTRLEIEECTDLGDDRVCVITRISGEGAGSGVPVESPRFVQTYEFRGDTVVAVRLHAGERR